MDQLLEVTNIKTESTDSTLSERLEILTVMQLNLFKKKSDSIVETEIYIKAESQEDGNEFACTSYERYPNDDIKFETEEPLIKIESEDVVDELIQDPLDVDTEIKDKQYISIDLESEQRIKTEQTEAKKDTNLLESDEYSHGSYGSEPEHSDEQFIRNCLDGKDKKYICKDCNKMFKKKGDWDRHLRIHTGEKPFKCDICEKPFNRKSTLDIHMLVHSGEKPHVCDVCKKDFSRKSILNKHKVIHSGVKPFSCHVCKKSFTQKGSLAVHKRLHTGDKPFTCDVCNKAFVKKSSLTLHRRTHTGEKPYCCDICNTSFASQANLIRHKKNHKN